MSAGCEYLGYRRLRAPRNSGEGMFEPAWNEIAGLIDHNLRCQADACYDVAGKCLDRLAREARAETLAAARRWTAGYRDVGDWATPPSGRVFLAGHQPQIFHPGVWLKNFALSRLAEEHDAVAVNLIVDSDTIRSRSIRVPGGTATRPSTAEIPFDASGLAVPFEERRILDSQVFASFGERVQDQIKPLVSRPLVGEYWRHVQDRSRDCDRLGLCLAQARHVIEGEWGARSLELPQSAVCDTDAYLWFVCHLLNESARFRMAHNEVAGVYRRAHRIRSLVHPVADLAEHDGWIEVPFWIWDREDPRRRRLFVRQQGDTLRLTDRRRLEISLPRSCGGNASSGVDSLRQRSEEGIRIRSRALVTTMWARLALGDLFLHGIGGAKYDQVTDALIARFFGLKPPAFLTVSGTLHLPVPHSEGASDHVRRLRDRLRRLEFQPERYLDELDLLDEAQAPEVSELAERKRNWIDKKATSENYRERFLAIRRLNAELRRWVEPIRKQDLEALERAEHAASAASILTWREYGFCLFPGEGLQDFFSRLLPKRA